MLRHCFHLDVKKLELGVPFQCCRCNSHKAVRQSRLSLTQKVWAPSILNSQIPDKELRGLFKIQVCRNKLRDLSKFSKVRHATREFVTILILSAVTGAIHTKAARQLRLSLTQKVWVLTILNSQIPDTLPA